MGKLLNDIIVHHVLGKVVAKVRQNKRIHHCEQIQFTWIMASAQRDTQRISVSRQSNLSQYYIITALKQKFSQAEQSIQEF